jgi:hypothetical protein
VTFEPADWAELYLTPDQLLTKIAEWVKEFGPALEIALEEFLETAQWPERERFRRKLTQRGLDDLSLDELLRDMPRSSWQRRVGIPDRVILSLQVLQQMPTAKSLLDACMAIVRRAYER